MSIPSRPAHVKRRLNPGRPLPKAEYSSMTDSEPVPRGKGEKGPRRGELKESEIMRLQSVGARSKG